MSRPSAEFRAIATGLQQVLFVAQRNIAVGDQVVLRELSSESDRYGAEHTSLWLCRKVTYRQTSRDEPALTTGWLALSLNTPVENEWATTALKLELSKGQLGGLSEEACWQKLIDREALRQRLAARQGRAPSSASL